MNKLLSVAIAAAFAAVSFSTVAQAQADKKTEAKAAGGQAVTTPDGKPITTQTGKVKKKPEGKFPTPTPKPKTDMGKSEVKSAGKPVMTPSGKDVTTKSK